MFERIVHTDNSKTTIIIRLMVGTVFLSEGIQKFLFANTLGSGRFAGIGFPNPDFLGPLVGTFEIVCGALVLVGLFTRLAAIPLFTIISVALVATKAPQLSADGLWAALHASRTDWAMFLGSIFLIIKGGGRWSADRSMRT